MAGVIGAMRMTLVGRLPLLLPPSRGDPPVLTVFIEGQITTSNIAGGTALTGAMRKILAVSWPPLHLLLPLGRITLTVSIVDKIIISGTVGAMVLVGGVMSMILAAY